MSQFGKKLSHDFNTFGRKNGQGYNSFANKMHMINHGVNKIAEYAIPALGIATMLQPEIAPFTGSLGAGIKLAQEGSRLGAQFADDIYAHQRPRNPQLQR